MFNIGLAIHGETFIVFFLQIVKHYEFHVFCQDFCLFAIDFCFPLFHCVFLPIVNVLVFLSFIVRHEKMIQFTILILVLTN